MCVCVCLCVYARSKLFLIKINKASAFHCTSILSNTHCAILILLRKKNELDFFVEFFFSLRSADVSR